MRAAVERVSPIDCPNHQIVSLVGNISADGSASFFDTVGRLADRTKARHYPMPLPFLMSSERERDQMLEIDPIAKVRAVAAKADLRLVGIGQMDQRAQVLVDGFVSREELLEMMRLGAVGELTGWAFDAEGRIIKGGTNAPPHQHSAAGSRRGPDHRGRRRPAKVSAIRAALQGASDQRVDHRRGDGKRHPQAVANSNDFHLRAAWRAPGCRSRAPADHRCRTANRAVRCRDSSIPILDKVANSV